VTDEQARKVAEAAVAYIVWRNKVPGPPNWYAVLDRLEDELGNAVQASMTSDEWWAATYAPDGWPE
jgi:hypothetical protein